MFQFPDLQIESFISLSAIAVYENQYLLNLAQV